MNAGRLWGGEDAGDTATGRGGESARRRYGEYISPCQNQNMEQFPFPKTYKNLISPSPFLVKWLNTNVKDRRREDGIFPTDSI